MVKHELAKGYSVWLHPLVTNLVGKIYESAWLHIIILAGLFSSNIFKCFVFLGGIGGHIVCFTFGSTSFTCNVDQKWGEHYNDMNENWTTLVQVYF